VSVARSLVSRLGCSRTGFPGRVMAMTRVRLERSAIRIPSSSLPSLTYTPPTMNERCPTEKVPTTWRPRAAPVNHGAARSTVERTFSKPKRVLLRRRACGRRPAARWACDGGPIQAHLRARHRYPAPHQRVPDHAESRRTWWRSRGVRRTRLSVCHREIRTSSTSDSEKVRTMSDESTERLPEERQFSTVLMGSCATAGVFFVGFHRA